MRIRNKKVVIAVVIVAAALLIAALVYKIVANGSSEQDPAESSLSSAAVSDPDPSSMLNDESSDISSAPDELDPEEGNIRSEASKRDFLNDYLDKQVPEDQQKSDDEELTIQAAHQILVLGGVWTNEDDPTIQLSFDAASYTITGLEQKVTGKYKIQSVEFGKPTDQVDYSYNITMDDGNECVIAVMGNDIYTFLTSKEMFPELGYLEDISFLKSAKISVGVQRNENGLTDQERDESGVSYITQ